MLPPWKVGFQHLRTVFVLVNSESIYLIFTTDERLSSLGCRGSERKCSPVTYSVALDTGPELKRTGKPTGSKKPNLSGVFILGETVEEVFLLSSKAWIIYLPCVSNDR